MPPHDPSLSLLKAILRSAPRRYKLPPLSGTAPPHDNALLSPHEAATTIAIAIEQARAALADERQPGEALRNVFLGALAQMIEEAMQAENGDPVFQAMVLRHHNATVREYASLVAHAAQDRRQIHAAVNAIAHPARQSRTEPGPWRDTLRRLHATAASASWSALTAATQELLVLADSAHRPAGDSDSTHAAQPDQRGAQALAAMPADGGAAEAASSHSSGANAAADAGTREALQRLLALPALAHLRRLDELAADLHIQHYQSLWAQNGPSSGSAAAIAQGSSSKKRGAAVEASAARALQALADKLNETESPDTAWRVITSMRVPPTIPADPGRAKTEWDVVLLQKREAAADSLPEHEAAQPADSPAAQQKATAADRRQMRARALGDGAGVWNVRVLVEAKASLDSVAIDFSRLLRGLQLLGHAEPRETYFFQAREGEIAVSGASLKDLPSEPAAIADTVLYCCDAANDSVPRLLSAAARMQLLSASVSLEFAAALMAPAQVMETGARPPTRAARAVADEAGASAAGMTEVDASAARMTEVEASAAGLDATGRGGTDANAAEGGSRHASAKILAPLWEELLTSPRWRAILHQFPALTQVRELIVHPDDLLAAVYRLD